MNLFTFNFNDGLIKTLVLSLLIFTLYSIALHKLDPKVEVFQNQWIKNYSVAEAFIYQGSPFKTVIVGSSMAARLTPDNLGDDVYNLSFEGGSALTGLHIIKESNILPETIFIEVNIIERALNEDMLNSLFVPVIWKIKKNVKSIQYTYQPINIALTFIVSRFSRGNVDKTHAAPNKEKLEFGIKLHSGHENNIDALQSNDIVDQKKLIDYFSSLGVKIVFFQMPVHKVILASKGYNSRNSLLEKMFPEFEFNWMKDSHEYETMDGMHLSAKSANEYTLALRSIINKN